MQCRRNIRNDSLEMTFQNYFIANSHERSLHFSLNKQRIESGEKEKRRRIFLL